MPLLNKKSKIVRLPVLYPAKMNGPIAQPPTGNILQREMNQCTNELYSKLLHLKHMGILSLSLRPTFTLLYDQSSPIHSRPTQSLSENSFQVLEFYGDSVLQHYISKMLCTTHAFMSPHLLTQFRICCVCNENLSSVYDALHLKTLIPYQELLKELEMNPPPSNGSSEHIDGFKKHFATPKDKVKAKADIVEALIGELSKVIEQEPNSGLPQVVSHCIAALDELMSFIYCSGELKFFSKFYNSASKSTASTTSTTSTTISISSPQLSLNQAAKPLPSTVNKNTIQNKKIHQPKKPLMKKASPSSPSLSECSKNAKVGLQTPSEFLQSHSPTTKQSKQLITPSQLLLSK